MAFLAVLAIPFTTAGLALSYGPNLAAGVTTIVLAGAVYLAVIVIPRFFKVRCL